MKMQSVLTVAALAAGAMLTAADIQLPKPQISGGVPLLTTLARRSTNRNMDGKALSKQQLSDLLWAANGINRPDGKRTAPTAMNKQEISLYAVLPDGAYRYEPTTHRLVEVAAEKSRLDNNASVVIVLVADRDKQPGEKWAAVDCGFVGQNIYLYCAANNLATVFKGSFNADHLQKLLKLEKNQVPMFIQPVGFPK